jgi:hypothetical protein
MITITPTPAVPAALPDSVSPALFGLGEVEGPTFAAELALAMGGGEPAKLPTAPAAAPGDGIRVTITFPAPDKGGALFEQATAGLRHAGPADAPAEVVTATATDAAAVPLAAPMPETPGAVRPAAGPPAPTPAGTATPLPAPDAAAPDAEVMAEPSPSAAPAFAPAEDRAAAAEETPAPAPRAPRSAQADGAAAPIEARPIEPRPPLASEPPAPRETATGDRAAPSGLKAKPETEEPSRSRLTDQPPPQVAERTVVADDDAKPLAIGDLAVTAPDVPPSEAHDGVSSDQPVPEAPAREPTPEAIGLAAAATPVSRPAGEAPRPGRGVVPAATAANAAAPTPPGDAAEPAPRSAPAEAKPREAAEARPRSAEPSPAADAAPPEAAPAADAAEPRASSPDRAEQPGPRAETTPRILAQPGMAAEALPQLQPVERATPASAAPPMPRAAPTPPVQQIAPVLITLAAGAAGMPDRLTLTLDPQELGRIEVEVAREGERRVAIAVLAERPETLHLLMRDAAILDRALAQAGVGAEGRSLAFDLGGGSDGRPPRGNDSGTPAARTPPQPEPARPRDPLSLLDIAI